jgi:hypothetical protein
MITLGYIFTFLSITIFTIVFLVYLVSCLVGGQCPIPFLCRLKFHKYPTWIGIRINVDLHSYQIIMNDGLARSQRIVAEAATSIVAKNILQQTISTMMTKAEADGKVMVVSENHYFARHYCIESMYNIYVVDKEYFE